MEPRECPQCHEQFKPRDRRQKYCSISCRTQFLSAKHRSATGPIKRRGARQRYEKSDTCLKCGNSLAGTQRRRFCSEGCAEHYWNDSRNQGVRSTFHFLSDIDEESLRAVCSICGPVDIRHAGTKRLKDGRLPYMCLNKRKTSSHHRKARESSWRKRGIILSYEEYEVMLARQGNACLICDKQFDSHHHAHVDHCHQHGHVRGLLCTSCNNGLGRFEDDPNRLEAAADYLRR